MEAWIPYVLLFIKARSNCLQSNMATGWSGVSFNLGKGFH